MKKLYFAILVVLFSLQTQPASALQLEKPLVINGCTAYPEGSWGHCCVEHDIMYWIGGTFEDRKKADQDLLQCVNKSGGSGQVLYNAVRIFGIHAFSKAWGMKSGDRLTAEDHEAIESEWALYNSIGQPMDFEFIVRESILFEPLNDEKRKLIRHYLTPFARTKQYQDYLLKYQRATGKKTRTLQFHD